MERNIRISDYDYPLPEGRIAKFPLERREQSKLLVCRDGPHRRGPLRADRAVSARGFDARIQQHESDPSPADFPQGDRRAHRNILSRAARPRRLRARLCRARPLPLAMHRRQSEKMERRTAADRIRARRTDLPARSDPNRGRRRHQIVEFVWDAPLAFGQLLEELGRIPIPPYLCRESEELDNSRYQTVYSRFEGSVAAPTAGCISRRR